MQQHVQLITIGTADLARARRFYVDGLGLAVVFEVPEEIVFVQVGHGLVLAIWGAASLAADANVHTPSGTGSPGISLASVVESPEAVDAWVERARTAGATVTKEAQRADFGGYHAYVTDPDGVLWEVAHNPGWSSDPDGTVHLAPIS